MFIEINARPMNGSDTSNYIINVNSIVSIKDLVEGRDAVITLSNGDQLVIAKEDGEPVAYVLYRTLEIIHAHP